MINYFEDVVNIISHSVRSIDEKCFEELTEECAKTLKSGHKIVASGLGKNASICEKFVGTMNSIGLPSWFLNTNSALHGDLGCITAGDLVILLTKSGCTQDSVSLYNHLESKNVNIWLVSYMQESVLAKRTSKKIIIELPHEGDPWNIVPNNSSTVNLIMLQAVAMNVLEKMDISKDVFKKNHPGGHIGATLNGKI